MDNTIELSQLAVFQKFATEFSTLGDDYVFTHVTEVGSHDLFTGGPIRFDGMAWLLCFGGRIDLEVNLQPVTLCENSVLVTNPKSFIELKDIDWDGFDCYMLFISHNFIRDVNFDLNILGSIPRLSSGQRIEPVQNITADEAVLLKEYFNILSSNAKNNDDNHAKNYSKSIARCMIAALTYQLIQIVSRRIKTPDDEPRSRFRRPTYVHDFIDLVHEYHRSERSVAFYAEKLFISPKYLSLLIKEATGRSAAEIIDEYVILEAKNLLRFSGKNIQQISYDLNFPNQSSFGKYFKHLVGMSPSEYQRSN